MRLKARLGILGRDDLEELLLPRRGAHCIEQRDLRPRSAGIVHGNVRISSCVPAAKPSLSGGTSTQPSARVSACTGQCPQPRGSTPAASRRTGTTSARPMVELILRASV